MSLATISWLDMVMVLMLVGSIGFGFHQGMLRQLVLLMALYLATVLSAQYYERFTEWLLVYFPGSQEVARVVAFFTMAAALTILATWLIWSAYQQTRLPSVVMLDEAGGAALGGLIGIFVIGLSLSLAQYAVQVPWPADSPARDFLHAGLVNSGLEGLFSTAVPLIQAVIRPWLPAGIPLLLGS